MRKCFTADRQLAAEFPGAGSPNLEKAPVPTQKDIKIEISRKMEIAGAAPRANVLR